ncbi:carboxymuconolactone decarboxylase family protein [Pseudooceanicola sp. C21-150M6]|uniref:carboxymuconolactone decarboxylase family protein n=1 Tax=Pseudooceanicola sp. C21-150M6 TaxID=3434355 RepID=UPI003D7FB24B
MTDSPCPPIADADWPDEISDMLDGFAGQLNVYRTMAHHPALLRAWAPLRQHVVKQSALGPIRSEVVILRTAARLGSRYEWDQHVSRARKLGMSDARIAAIRDTPEGEDALIVQAVDALIDARQLSPEAEARLADAIGRHAVIDLIATVGFYSVLGYLLMTYRTPLDDDIAQELYRAPFTPD